jgi:hypothetical protein
VSASLFLVVVLAAAYTIAGVGMHMSALTMNRMAIQMPGMAMPPVVWSAAYAAGLPDVVGDDGRDDGAERRADGPCPRRHPAQAQPRSARLPRRPFSYPDT